jgi:purine-binding chemotaxis protein CheW
MADAQQYVTLGIAKEIFAVPVTQVQEILDVCPIAALPRAPAYLLGMIDVRGRGIPVIDLRMKIGIAAVEDGRDTRILVLTVATEAGERLIGLKADRVFEVTSLDNDSLEPPPDIGAQWQSELIAGVGRRKGAFVTVLDLKLMFASEKLGAIADPAGLPAAQNAA